MRIPRNAVSALAASALLCTVAAADPLPEPSFGIAGYAIVDFGMSPASNDRLTAVAELPDGRIVTAGTVSTTTTGGVLRPESRVGLARLTAQGLPDASFGARTGHAVLPGWHAVPAGRYVARAMALQRDGKIVVAGSFIGDGAPGSDIFVLRALADGSGLDTQFSGDGIAYLSFDLGGDQRDAANAVLIQPDGRIVVAGSARIAAQQQYAVAARLLADGQIDRGFSGDGKIAFDFDRYDEDDSWTAEITALALQSDGKIVLAGNCSNYYQDHPLWQPNQDFVVARRLGNGGIDTGFGFPILNTPLRSGFASGEAYFGSDDIATSVAVSELPGHPAGTRRIVVGGWHAGNVQGQRRLQMMAYTDVGMLDANFGHDGIQDVALAHGGDGYDAQVRGIAVHAYLRWTGTLLSYARTIVFAGDTREQLAGAPRRVVVGSLPYASGYQFPDELAVFTADLDADGTPDDAGAQAMVLRGNVVTAAGTTTLARRHDDFLVTRVVLDP